MATVRYSKYSGSEGEEGFQRRQEHGVVSKESRDGSSDGRRGSRVLVDHANRHQR